MTKSSKAKEEPQQKIVEMGDLIKLTGMAFKTFET